MRRWAIIPLGALFALLVLQGIGLAQPPGGETDWVRPLAVQQDEIVLELHIPAVTLETVEVAGQAFQRVVLPGAGHTTEVGLPGLPTFGRYVAVPVGAKVEVEVLEAETTTYTGVLAYPAQPPQPDCGGYQAEGFAWDTAFYEQDAWYPEQPAVIRETGWLRDVRYGIVSFYPAQYNPARQELTVYTSLRVRVSFVGGEGRFTDGRYRAENYEQMYRRLFLNYGQIESSPPRITGGVQADGADLLIITAPDFLKPAQELADWKVRRGIRTVVKTTDETGTSLSAIDAYIQNAYDTWSPRPAYVLFLGDAEFIPTHYVTSHPYHGQRTGTDLYYLTASGTDYMPDIAGARTPASTEEEAQRVVDSILQYEQNPPSDSTFYSRFQVAAYFQDNDNNGRADRLFTQTSEEIHDFLEDTKGKTATRCYTTNSSNPQLYYYGDSVPSEVRTALLAHSDYTCINNDMSQGRFILNHRDHGGDYGWGDPEYAIRHLRALSYSDPGELPVVFSINCLTGWFDSETDEEGCLGDDDGSCSTTSFSEEFLMNGQAIAVFGATRVSYSWYNDALVKGYYDGIWNDMLAFGSGAPFQDDLYRLGDALGWGKAYLLTQYPPPDSTTLTTMEIHHLFGDPTLEIWTDVPQSMAVSHNATAAVGATSLVVNVNTAGARITLVQDGAIVGEVASSVSGNNTVTLSPAASQGPLYVTATKHNYRPYMGTVDVGAVHTVSGCVYNGGSGVPDVWVDFGDGLPPARTDASGCYSRRVADGSYILSAGNERWVLWPDTNEVSVSGSNVSNVNFNVQPYRARAGYSENLDNGRLSPAWTVAGGTLDGRVGILDCPHSGDYALILDQTDYNNFATAAAYLSADLSCRTDAVLTFWWRDNADEDHPDDGVYIRRNAGDSWCKVFSFSGSVSSYIQQTINLNTAANTCWGSTALTGEFQIKFQQYDNYRWTGNDGIAIDDISITASGRTFTWDGSTDTDWDEPTNWDLGCVPGPNDTVLIPTGAPRWPNVNALAYAKDLTIQDGARVDANSNGVLNVYGNWTEQGTGYFNSAAGTVIFRGGAQAITPGAGSHFYNLKVGDGASATVLTPNAGLDVNRNVTIMAGATLAGGSYTHRVSRSWQADGTFAPGTSTVLFDGGAVQTAAGASGINTNTYDAAGLPLSIPDNGCLDSMLNVALAASIQDVDVTIGQITHARDGDLDIYVRHPDATEVELSTDNGGTGDHYIDTVLDDEAATLITSGSAPFTGRYRPEGSLALLDGKGAQGDWTLHICDDRVGTTGTLEAWSLTISSASSGARFYNLTVAAATTLELDSDATVQGALVVEAGGLLDLGPHSLAVDGTVTNNGGLRQTRDAPNATTTAFLNISTNKYYGVDLRPISGDMGLTTVTVYGNQTCAGFDTAVQRCFEIDPGTVRTADVTLYFRDAEQNGQNTPNVLHWNGTQWDLETFVARDLTGTENNWVQATGVDAYSPFGVADHAPTAVKLMSFAAAPAAGGVLVTWETASEYNNVGFNLYRSATLGDIGVQLNEELIPSKSPGGDQGASYEFLDTGVEAGATYFYWLEDVDLYGRTALHGPVMVTPWRAYLPLIGK